MIALGVLIACLGGLGAAFLYSTSTQSQSVLMVTTAVARGETLEASDLQPVTIGSVPGISTVAADSLNEQVGKTALADLSPGTLLPAEAVGSPQVPVGTAEVGLKLAAGRTPTEAISPETPVQLVEVTPAEGSQPRVFAATVSSGTTTLSDGQSYAFDVRVAAADAPAVAALAAQENLAVVRLADS